MWLVVRLAISVFGLAVLLAASSPEALAVPSGCAMVAGTPDGFLAIRSGPGPEHPEIERLRPGQIVQAAAPSSLHPWQEVDVLLEIADGKPRIVRQLHGYAHGRYLKRVEC
jgi:hypothetical protein